MALLEVRDLEVFYGVIRAIKGISFDVNEGEIIALPDGSSELVILIDALGCAKVHINPIDVECI